jgi:tetratricopeptide repeat protein
VNVAAAVLAVLSAVHLPASAVPGAQAAFDRGLFFYYAYDGGDAEIAFAQAAANDPRSAMAYWGEALADGPDLNTPMTQERFALGAKAIAAGVALEGSATPAQRAYVDAMALRYKGSWSDWQRDDAAYAKAMTALAGAVPADDSARVLAAEALLERGGLTWDGAQLADADSRRGLALIDTVLAANPNDVMANHLCLHAYDEAADRTPALPCALRLDAATLPPQAEHLAHMPAHYWIETGNYAAAVASSERALALFSQLQTIAQHDSEHDRYLRHDTYVGYSAAMMLGNYALARLWSARMETAFGTPFAALTALRFGRYADAYALAKDSTPSDLAVRECAALRLGRIAEAHDLAARLRKGTTAGYLAPLFFARLAQSDGNADEAGRWIDRAAEAEKSAFSAELLPLLPAAEVRGALALGRHDNAAAVAAFRAALGAYPNDPRALFGLAEALTAQGHAGEALAIRHRFQTVWTPSDTTLTEGDL